MRTRGAGGHRQQELLTNASVFFLTLAVIFAVAEALTRILVPDPDFLFENQIGLFERDPLLGYKNRPNFRGYAQGFIRVETNSLGYRGRELAREKPPRTYRILGLGDSVMWGVGVQDESTYLRRLEQNLNETAAKASGVRYEIVNAAAVGYSTHQQLRVLQSQSRTLCPDLVLVGFEPNDAYPTEDPFYNVNDFHEPRRPEARRRDYAPPEDRPISYFYSFSRRRLRLIQRRWKAGAAARAPEPWTWPPGSFEAVHWPDVQGHLRAMKRISREQGFPLLVLVLPTLGQAEHATGGAHAVQRQVAEFLESEGIEHIVFNDLFRGHGREVFIDTMHLAPQGHLLVAAAIYRHLESRGFLPSGAAGSLRRCEGPGDAPP